MLSALGYLVLVGMAAAMLYSYTKPPFAFVMVLCLYPLKQLQMTYMSMFAVNSSYFNFLVFACVAAGVVGNLVRTPGFFQGYFNRVLLLLLVLYAYVLAGITYSPVPDNALARVRDGAPYWVMQVLLLPLLFNSLDDFRKVFVPALLVGCVTCVLFFTNPNASFLSGRLTLNIPLAGADYRGNPLATAQLGGHIAIIATLMLPARKTWLMHAIRLGTIVLGLGIAIAAGSRGQLALAVMSMVFFYPMARQVKNIKQFFLTAAGFGVFAVVAYVTMRLFLGQDAEQMRRWDLAEWGTQTTERSADAFRLLVTWWGNPAAWPFGLGTNYFSYIRGETLSYAHNVIIELISENGIVGITMYSIVGIWVLRSCLNLWQDFKEDPVGRAVVACLCAQIFYLTLLSYKQGTFVGLPEPYYLWVVAAKVAIQERARIAAWYASQPWLAYDQPSAERAAS
jgi:hypothetical protein